MRLLSPALWTQRRTSRHSSDAHLGVRDRWNSLSIQPESLDRGGPAQETAPFLPSIGTPVEAKGASVLAQFTQPPGDGARRRATLLRGKCEERILLDQL